MRIETLPGVYAKIDNRPGSLQHVTRLLGERQLNIDAISAETVGSTGFTRILTKKPREAIDILRAANVDAHETEFVFAHPENRPGELARICSELAAGGVNIESVLTMPDGRLGFRTHDNALASRILGKL